MRRTFLLAGLLVLLASPAVAQGGGGGGGNRMGPPKSGQGLLQDITLTADQQKQVDSIWKSNEPMREQMRAQMQSGQQPDSAARAHMMTMRDQQTKAYRAVLTPDQAKVFDKNVAEMRERMRSMGGPGGNPK
jgi:Spy/CpxP family protein refolding chaperone